MLCPTRIAKRVVQMWGLAVIGAAILFGQPSVLTWRNDNARTGQNLEETVLTPATVNAATFGKLFSMGVDGRVNAQPLYVPNLTIPGKGLHNVLYVATEHDSVYAFDADNGAALLHVSLLAVNETAAESRSCGSQDSLENESGITATPVIDPGAGPHGTIYLVAMSKDSSNNYHQRLHALDLTTFGEEFHGPVEVMAAEKRSGADVQTFLPEKNKERAALLLSNGVVYTSWSSHCDIGRSTSWVIGYNSATLAQSSVLHLLSKGAGGSSPQADSAGNLYMPLTVEDFAMSKTDQESSSEQDLGSVSAMLLPPLNDTTGHSRDLAVMAGQDSNIYVMDRANLGKFHATTKDIYQQLSGVLAGGVWSSPAWFNNTLYYGAQGNVLKAFAFANGQFGTNPASQTSATFPYPGTTPSISANGTSNGIVWAISHEGTAVLHAYSADNLGNELYNSNQAPMGRDSFGSGNKFMAPTIVNGKVYVGSDGDASGQPGSLVVFGKRDLSDSSVVFGKRDQPPDFSFTVTPATATVPQGGSAVYTITLTPIAGFSGTVTFNVSTLPSGISALLSPNMITGSGTASLTLTAVNGSIGPNTFTVTGVSGSLSHNVSANLTIITPTAVLSIIKHSGIFLQGQQNAPYFLTVSNGTYTSSTSGTVTVTETVPAGLTLVGMSGSGWACASNTCSRSDVLGAGASYPTIIVLVNVPSNATSPQVNHASVSGGGSATANFTDSTTIDPPGSHPGSHIGVFESTVWQVDMNGNGQVDTGELFGWGAAGDIPAPGDWNGTGNIKAAVFRGSIGHWIIDFTGNHQLTSSTQIVGWGQAGDVPVVGDWNHSGTSKIGVFRNGLWFLDIAGDHVLVGNDIISWGPSGGVPVVGDWNGDGTTKIGVFQNGLWYLDTDGNHQLTSAKIIGWGHPGDIPVVGDWNGDGKTKIGVYSGGMWFLDVAGDHQLVAVDIFSWGVAGDIPFAGDWDNTGTSKIGVFRPGSGLFFLDANGSHVLTLSDIISWGKNGDVPVPGRW